MRFHILQHVVYEHPGSILEWLNSQNYTFNIQLVLENQDFPELHQFDVLIIMGGPMGVHDEHKFTWLSSEKEFISNSIKQNKKLIGICLGAQLIADCLGANVYKNDFKEIGWFPVNTTDVNSFDLPGQFTTFHWHGDTFSLPENAILLFKSKACLNQGFLVENQILALQFHPEVNEHLLNEMVLNGKNELEDQLYIQTEEEIVIHTENIKTNQHYLNTILDTFLKK